MRRFDKGPCYMEENDDGRYVLHSDHAAELARVEGERDKALEAARVAIEQMDRWRLVAQAGATMQTQTLTENNLIRLENALLRAECEAWRDNDVEAVVRIGDTREPRSANVYYDAQFWKAVETARAATDAANILKGAGT